MLQLEMGDIIEKISIPPILVLSRDFLSPAIFCPRIKYCLKFFILPSNFLSYRVSWLYAYIALYIINCFAQFH